MKLFTIVFLIAFAVVIVEARNLQAPKKVVGYGFEKPKGSGKRSVGETSKHFGSNDKDRQVHGAPGHGGQSKSTRKPTVSSSTARPSTTTTASPSAGSSSTTESTVPLSALAQWCYEQALTDVCRYLVG